MLFIFDYVKNLLRPTVHAYIIRVIAQCRGGDATSTCIALYTMQLFHTKHGCRQSTDYAAQAWIYALHRQPTDCPDEHLRRNVHVHVFAQSMHMCMDEC